jgi:Suppressor of fused protein (SUFU)
VNPSKRKTADYVCDYFGKKPEKAVVLDLSKDIEVHLLTFENYPYEGCTTLITNGLHELDNEYNPNSRQELIFMYEPKTYESYNEIVNMAEQYTELYFVGECNSIHTAMKAIDVKSNILIENHFRGFYATYPGYLPEGFSPFSDGQLEIQFVLIVPVFLDELGFIEANGYKAIDDLIVELDPNLCDLSRKSILLE